MDTSTPAGNIVFTVLGTVAELERSLIAERVRAGLRNARAKGKMLGRPRTVVDATAVGHLRSQGASWSIANQFGVGVGIVFVRSKNVLALGKSVASAWRLSSGSP